MCGFAGAGYCAGMSSSRARSRFTYANVAATLALIIAIGTGSATAAKMITGTDIKNESITNRDVKNNSLVSADVKNGTLQQADLATTTRTSLTDTSPWETIPSGTTVRGTFGVRHVAVTTTGFQQLFLNLPAVPPVGLTDATISFDAGSSPIAVNTDASCTGNTDNPTAPAGKLCAYLLNHNNVSGLDAVPWGESGPSALGGWALSWIEDTAGVDTEFRGTWAYTAP
mgnify:CR=1 FL=1